MEDRERQKQLVYALRRKTGRGLMDCKIALRRNDWDIDKAEVFLKDYERPGVLYKQEA